MDHPKPTAQSTPLFPFSSAHVPAEIAAAVCSRPLESAQGGSGRVRRPRISAHGARRVIILLGALGAASAWSMPASASDGVLEINQACALQTGCFSGDTAGLPVTITGTAGRSYRLTSDLVVPNENTSGIQVFIDDVGIDLNNFTIRGPVVCSGTPLACTPNTGSGVGIERGFSLLSGTSVRNGSIRGMGNNGVLLGVQSEVTHVRARSNRLSGIDVESGSTVSGNAAYQNGNDGIFANTGSTVSGNTTRQNGGNGIQTSSGSTVSGNTAYQNGSDGILTASGSTVSGNSAYQNGGNGIQTGTGVTVAGNTAYNNEGDGIQASSGSTVSGNTVRFNTGFGLDLLSGSGYRENVITNNTAGTVNGPSLVNLGNNTCNGSTVCP